PDEDFVKQFQDRERRRAMEDARLREISRQQEDLLHLATCQEDLEDFAGIGAFDNNEWKQRNLPGWMCSLEGLGVCTYKGGIPAKAITRIAYFGRVFHPIFREFAKLPRLTIREHSIGGEHQRRCTKFLLGDF